MAHFPGFDTGSYPGDSQMQTWKQSSPYQWTGFYLTAPCHTAQKFTPWEGHYATLRNMGWGLAVLYVGLQQDGCGSANLSRQQGTLHGVDAVTRCQTEAFPQAAIIFLDVEHFDGPVSPIMKDYYQGWIAAVLESNFYTPGTYCADTNFDDIYLAAQQEYATHGFPNGGPAIWIVKTNSAFDPVSNAPTDNGIQQSNIWQGRVDNNESYGGVGLSIDQDTADSDDPSHTRVTAPFGTRLFEQTMIGAGSGDLQGTGAIARMLVDSVIDKLAAQSDSATGTRLFFPNGIELIDVSVDGGLAKPGVSVSIRVAGPKQP